MFYLFGAPYANGSFGLVLGGLEMLFSGHILEDGFDIMVDDMKAGVLTSDWSAP